MAGKGQKKQDGVKKENFTTSINSELLYKFRVYCAIHKLYQNELIEKFIKDLLEKEGEEIGNTDK